MGNNHSLILRIDGSDITLIDQTTHATIPLTGRVDLDCSEIPFGDLSAEPVTTDLRLQLDSVILKSTVGPLG